MNKEDVAGYLRIAASGLKEGSLLFLAQPSVSRAMQVAGGLLDIAVLLLERGVEPVEHITRLVDLDAMMKQARADVDAEAEFDANK